MIIRVFSLAAIASVVILAGGGQQASAATCSSEYTAANGATTISGAPNIGTVSSGCEIGPFKEGPPPYNNLGPPASVSSTVNPSIYEFVWGGGALSIQEELGNNGMGNDVNVELGLSTATLNSNHTLSSTVASISILYQPGQGGAPTAPVYVINDYNLAAGTYILDTYLGACGDPSGCRTAGTPDDPVYAVLFTPEGVSATPSATPLPAAFPLFAGGLGFVGFLARRRKRSAGRAIATAN
jgi:hypothetical protein